MHTSVKRVLASKSSKKSSTQTTISRFFTSASDQSQPIDKPGINFQDRRHEGRGKVRALYAEQTACLLCKESALISYYSHVNNVHRIRMHKAFAVSKQHRLK